METLKPQFVPGQAIGPNTGGSSGNMEEKLNILQLQQENESLKAQVIYIFFLIIEIFVKS